MPRSFPPGPRDWTLGLSLSQGLKHRLLDTYFGLQRDYGDRVCQRVGPWRLYFFFHPDDVHDVLVTHAKSIIRDPRPLRVFAQWNGSSVIIAEGEAWKRQRRMVQPAFLSKRFAGYAEKMVVGIDRLSDRLVESIGTSGSIDVDVDREMTRLTMDIICQTMFSSDVSADFDAVSQAVISLADITYGEMLAPFIWPRWLPTAWNRRKNAAITVLDSFVWKLVRQRRAEGVDRGDLLSMLLNVVDEEGDGGGMTDEQVRNEVMTLMLAGHDTTAAGLIWMWWLLAKHPEVQLRCRDELSAVCHERSATFADLPSLPFLAAVIKESLRLYPPAFGVFLRKAIEDVTIGEYELPKGSLIAMSSYVTHRDARWYPEPERFDPGRFLPPRIEQIPHGAWFPFGMGPRVCIGQSFALTEMQLIAASLLQRFAFSIPPGEPEPVPHVTTAIRPKERLTLRVTG